MPGGSMDPEFQDLDGEPDDEGLLTIEPTDEPDIGDDIEVSWGKEDPDDENDNPVVEGEQDENRQDAVAPKEDEDDISQYGKKVQKRIQRERAVTARERQARLQVEQENAQLKAQLQQLSHENLKVTGDQLDAEIAAKMNRYKAVRAEFDPDKGDEEAQLLLDVADLRRQKENLLRNPEPRDPVPERVPVQDAQPKQSSQADRWVQRNSSWYGKDGNEHLTAAAEAIDKKLYAEGYDPNSAEYFAELDRRLQDSVKVPRVNPPRTNPNVAPVDRGGAVRPTNRVVLTAQDRAFMQQVKLDPNNPAHVKAYAEEKLKLDRSSRR